MTTTERPAQRADSVPSQASPRPHGEPGLAVALVALAGALLLNTLLGPLLLDVLDYPVSATIENQLVGLELVTVVLVAPWCLVAAGLAFRGHRAAGPLALGPSAYTAYMFVQYVVGPRYATYGAGVLLHLALFVLGLSTAIWAWVLSTRSDLPRLGVHRRAHAVVLALLAAFVVSRYAGLAVGAVDHHGIPAEFADEAAFYWSIVLLDLGIVLPATVAAAVAVWRGARLAAAARYGVVGWFALVPPSVAAMGAAMVVRDDPYAAPGQVVALTAVAVLFGLYAVVVFRPLFSRR